MKVRQARSFSLLIIAAALVFGSAWDPYVREKYLELWRAAQFEDPQ